MVDKIRKLWNNQEKQITNLDPDLMSHVELCKDKWWGKDFPKGEEYWKYVKFSSLSKVDWVLPSKDKKNNKIIFSGQDCHKVELNNFNLDAEWEYQGEKPEGLEIIPLQTILKDKKLIQNYSEYLFKQGEGNFFEDLNQSFLGSGVIIKIGGQDSPISLEVIVSACLEKSFVNPRIIVIAESMSQTKISLKTEALGEQFLNLRKDFHIAEGAQLRVHCKEQGSSKSYILSSDNLYIDKSAQCHFFDMTLPSKWSRHNVVANLQGQGSEVQLMGAYLNNKDNFIDHHTTINHQKPQTFSQQNYKGILADQSRAVFNGCVYIAPGAEKSNSEQLNKNLLLSEKAEINTKPELQIYNDDVKAAHGATVGQLDKEQIFYLQSRGIKKEAAWQFLSKAFVFDLFDNLSSEDKSFFTDPLEQTLQSFDGVTHGF